MLFTFSTKNLCIVFPQWRVTGLFSLLLSLAAVVLLVAGYEALRDFTRQYELATLGQRDLPSSMYLTFFLLLSFNYHSPAFVYLRRLMNGRFDNSLSWKTPAVRSQCQCQCQCQRQRQRQRYHTGSTVQL